MNNHGVKTRITKEKIFELLLDMDERMATKDDIRRLEENITNIEGRMATKEDLRDYATKNDLEVLKEDILKEIRPLHRAIDKDAKTIIDHEKRIAVLEKSSVL